VFTPFYKNAVAELPSPRTPLPVPSKIDFYPENVSRLTINGLKLLPNHPWSEKLTPYWQMGEDNAHQRLEDFIDEGLNHYKQGRDFPALNNVSRLSPHLHFGEVSPHQVWHAARLAEPSKDQEHFMRELGWREFSYHLLYHFPDLPEKNFNNRFDRFPWKENNEFLKRWQQGQTGFPLVDAGMRELWQTGYMHNRVRMVVGSFLVKNLLLHWHHGEAWFWDTLLDADLANNSASWQWVAGCGADAAPYFRIFNPCTQGEKFDPQGKYTRKFVPELAKLPDKYLYHPWDAPAEVLKEAGITLGETYPEPMVDLKASRDRALAAYDLVKG
jgi:deoxyribodipyrimidine photo-lyase